MTRPFIPFDKFEKSCAPLAKPLEESMAENCDAKLAPEGPVPCSEKPCPPYWQRTTSKRCLANGLVDIQELDGCGNERWVRTSEVVVWTDTTETTCVSGSDAGEKIYMQQVNQCGDTRQVFTGRFCCVPAWVNSDAPPVYDCNQSMLRVNQEDGCGNTRLFTTEFAVAWTDNGSRRCLDDRHQRQEVNQCGTTRWVDNGALVFVDTGDTRCVGALIEKEQVDQCGTLRWIATDVALTWTDTGVQTCVTDHLVEQDNQCNATRLDNRGPVVWTNTGETRCEEVSGMVENRQINQCGTLRWDNTGISCDIGDITLPISIGPGCITTAMGQGLSYSIQFGNSGLASEAISPYGSPYPFAWASGVVNGALYEIKVVHTFAQGFYSTYTGPTGGVWTSLANAVSMVWAMSPKGVPYGNNLSGTISIREVGNDATLVEMLIDPTFMAIGLECP